MSEHLEFQIGKYLVRHASPSDIDEICSVNSRAFDGGENGVAPVTPRQVESWLRHYPIGLLVACRQDGSIVSVGMAMCTHKHAAKDEWHSDTDHGMCTNADPNGDLLYGVSLTSLSPGAGSAVLIGGRRSMKILAPHIKHFVLHARLAGLDAWMREDSLRREADYPWLEDRTLQFYEANGFEPMGMVPNFLEGDLESRGWAGKVCWSVNTL